jgi:hypothetical protein
MDLSHSSKSPSGVGALLPMRASIPPGYLLSRNLQSLRRRKEVSLLRRKKLSLRRSRRK